MKEMFEISRIHASVPKELFIEAKKYGIFVEFDNFMSKTLYNEIIKRKMEEEG